MKWIVLLFVLFVCGCWNGVDIKQKPSDRFKEVYVQGDTFNRPKIIIEDTKTGVQYLLVKTSYGGGLTKLEK